MLLPSFNFITGKDLALNFDANVIIGSVCIAVITGLIAGSYPSFHLSGFNTAKVLRGKLKTSPVELWTRKGLVVFQFSLSVIFIVAVLVIYRQSEMTQTKNLGYDKDIGHLGINWVFIGD
jgi:putative ABC transport system permease protein